MTAVCVLGYHMQTPVHVACWPLCGFLSVCLVHTVYLSTKQRCSYANNNSGGGGTLHAHKLLSLKTRIAASAC